MSRLDSALQLADAGCHVIALRPGSKEPATRHGCLDATRDPAVIREQFRLAGPDANVGVATGTPGPVVVDIDGPVARDGWLRLCREHNPAPTISSRTPRGWHLWFRAPQGRVIRNSASKIAPGIDTRGVGGYVVAPPSAVQPSATKPGGSYRWRAQQHPLADLPAWVVELLEPPAPLRLPAPVLRTGAGGYAIAALRGEVQRVVDAPEGTRNTTLRAAAWALGTLVGAQVLDECEARTALELAGHAVGLGPIEVTRTVTRGIRDGARSPRQLRGAA